MITSYTRENALIVGKLLFRKQPKLAAELLSSHQPEKPHDTDLDHIEHYLQHFCRIHSITIDSLPRNSDLKRIFICCLLSIYCPDLLRSHGCRMHGLGEAVAQHFNQTRQWINMLIQEVLVQYKVYDDFRGKVDETAGKLKIGGGDE